MPTANPAPMAINPMSSIVSLLCVAPGMPTRSYPCRTAGGGRGCALPGLFGQTRLQTTEGLKWRSAGFVELREELDVVQAQGMDRGAECSHSDVQAVKQDRDDD